MKLTAHLFSYVANISFIVLTSFDSASAQVPLQADFNGTGTLTGDGLNKTANITTCGTTGALTSAANLAATIATASPLFTGEAGYLHLNNTGAGSVSAGVTFNPFADANTFDSWCNFSGPSFDTLNGGFDFYFRDNLGSANWTNTGTDFRPVDVSGGHGGLRITMNAPTTNSMQAELIADNGAGGLVLDLRVPGAVSTTANSVYHAAVAFSTSATGTITLKLFLAPGTTPINPLSNAYLVASGTSTATLPSTGTNAVTHGFYAAGATSFNFLFGQCGSAGSHVRTDDFGCFRIFASLPDVFPAPYYLPDLTSNVVPVNEPNPLPPGFDLFSPPVHADTSALTGTPAAAEWIRTANPGETVVVAGNQLSTFTGTDAGKDSQFLVFGQNNGSLQTTPADILRETGNNAAIRMDPTMPKVSAYMVWPRNATGTTTSNGYGTPFVVNKADAWWVGPDTVATSGTVSLYGRNLTSNLEGASPGSAYIYIQNSTSTPTLATIVGTPNPYKVDFLAPPTAGTYSIWAHNGHGEHYGWSGPITLTVTAPITYTNTIDVTSAPYGADKTGLTDSTAAIRSAIAAAASTPYSILNFPTGTYTISGSLESPVNTEWKGQGPTLSEILMKKPPGLGWVTTIGIPKGVDNITVTGLQLNAGTTVEWFGIGAYTAGEPTVSASNLTITNCSVIGAGTFPPAQPTISGFSNGATTLTVSSAANLFVGEPIYGTGLSNTIYGISGTTITLGSPTGTTEPAETIMAPGNPEQSLVSLTPTDHLLMRNCTFTGSGIYLLDSYQCIIDGCTFNGMWDAPLLNIKGDTSELSCTNNLGQDYDNALGYTYNPSSSSYTGDSGIFPCGWSQGPFFKGLNGDGARHNLYFGNNTSKNMGVRLGNPTGNNWGEQISLEQENGQFISTVASGATSAVTLSSTPSGSWTSTPLIATIIHGTGTGQWRDVTSISGATVNVATPWNVPPDTSSTVELGWFAENVVSYANNFQGKSDRVGPNGAFGITGFLPYQGVMNAIADDDTTSFAEYGIHAQASVSIDGTPTSDTPSYFGLFMNNSLVDCQTDIFECLGTNTYTNTSPMAVIFGHVYRNNTSTDATAGDTLRAVEVISEPGVTYSNAMDMLVFEWNHLTDTAVGVWLNDVGTTSIDGSFIFNSNDITQGTTTGAAISKATVEEPATSGTTYGIDIIKTEPICLVGNNWTETGTLNFSKTYYNDTTGSLTPVLEAPARVFDKYSSSGSKTTMDVPVVWDSGATSGTWTATTDPTAAWMSFSPTGTLTTTTGTLTGENDGTGTFTLVCSPSAGTGTHTGSVTLQMGGQTKKLMVNYVVGP